MKSIQSILLRFYVRQVLWSAGCSILAGLLFGITIPQSSHLDTMFIVMYISLMIAFLFAVLSLTLFLNINEFIRSRIFLSGLVWLSAPTLLLTYVIYKVPEFIGIISTIPYVLGLIITFWMFRRNLNRESNLPALEIVTKESRKKRSGENTDNWMSLTGGGE